MRRLRRLRLAAEPRAQLVLDAGARYTYGTIEAQTRQLADCAFLLSDYQTALTYYRAAGGEFKSDKAWTHHAGCLEMAALCLHLTDGSRRDMEEAVAKAATAAEERDRAVAAATEGREALRENELLKRGMSNLSSSFEQQEERLRLELEEMGLELRRAPSGVSSWHVATSARIEGRPIAARCW